MDYKFFLVKWVENILGIEVLSLTGIKMFMFITFISLMYFVMGFMIVLAIYLAVQYMLYTRKGYLVIFGVRYRKKIIRLRTTKVR